MSATLTAEVLQVVRNIVGPLVVGVLVNGLVTGACMQQYIQYLTSPYKDTRLLRYTVIWLAFIDLGTFINNVALIWHYAVDHFGDATVLSASPWLSNFVLLYSTLNAVPVQIFLATRIRQFSKQSWLFFILSFLSVGIAGIGWLVSIKMQLTKSIEDRPTLINIARTYLCLSTALDTSLTALMVYYLQSSKTVFNRTNKILSRYIQISLQSALPVTTCTICILTFTEAFIYTNIAFVFTLNLGRTYSMTILSTLNARGNFMEVESESKINTFGAVNLRALRTRNMEAPDISIKITKDTSTVTDQDWGHDGGTSKIGS